MSKKFSALIATLVITLSLLLTILPVSAGVDRIAAPRFDELWMKVITDPDAATSAFQLGEVDVNPSMIRWSNVEKLIGEGHTVTAAPGFHMCYAGINTRDVVPDDYEQPDAGRPLAPLNWTSFRQALGWSALSEDQKSAAILEIYGGPINVPLGTVVPPALGVWHDPTVPCPGGDYELAKQALLDGGFTIVDGILYQPNGVEVRGIPGDYYHLIEVLSPIEAPTSVELCQRFVDQWNDFFTNYLEVTNVVLVNAAIPFGTEIDRAFYYRNFDLYWLCWGLGRFPDFLYVFFHSNFTGVDENNSCGLEDPELDNLLYTLAFGLVYEEKIEACHLAQRKIVTELVPYVPMYSRTYYDSFRKESETHYLTNMVNMKGYGAFDNGWTWSLMHWSDMPEGGSATYILGDIMEELHPGWASKAYEWHLLDRLFAGLIATTPELGDLPWIACDWTVEAFDWEPLNIYNGTKITFQIRSDVYWHDGEPVTVEDIKFAWEFMSNFPRYKSTWQYFAWAEIIDPCTISAYMNVTSQWVLYDLAGLALLWPEHIYGHPPEGVDPVEADVWNIPYEDWTGNPPPAEYPFMKALIGCGPYVFDYYDPATEIAHVVKYQANWVDGPVKQNFIAPQRVGPGEEFEYYVELVNAGSKTAGELGPVIIDKVDVTIDGEVSFTIPGPIVIDPFDYVVLGPYTTSFDTPGLHYLDCHTYEEGTIIDTYEHPIWITIREDINLDFKVRVDDVLASAVAFGSAPGHPRWDSRVDINDDFKVRVDDILAIALKFGWG